MIPLALEEIAQATNGIIINNKEEVVIRLVSTDSRTIGKDCLFIALQGDKFDAHQFVEQVKTAGAVSLLVHKKIDTDLPYILVEDTHKALGLLGAFVKQQISGLQCAAITGSNGKTTTKELLSQILLQVSDSENSVLSTAGNFNNDIGLPLTLLRLTEENQFAVVELGANHIGEIDYTAQLVKPDVALINNVLPAHLEGFGSIEGVAKAKGEIWASIRPGGTAVVNLDSDFSQQYIQQLTQLNVHILTFSQCLEEANIYASNINFDQYGKAFFTLNVDKDDKKQEIGISLSLPGKHNISNALAATAMAVALGCKLDTIRNGLQLVSSVAGRVNSIQINDDITVIDDTYNANSASIKAAIDLLVQFEGEHLLILGDMAELGEYGEKEHVAVGKYAAEQGVEQLLTIGKLTKHTSLSFKQHMGSKAQHFETKADSMTYINKSLLQNSKKLTILVKGSRGTEMEFIVAYIKQLQL